MSSLMVTLRESRQGRVAERTKGAQKNEDSDNRRPRLTGGDGRRSRLESEKGSYSTY